jgi:hypothetical protein
MVGDRRLTLPLSANQARTYLDAADKAFELREDAASPRWTADLPAVPLPAEPLAPAPRSREMAGIWRAIEGLNPRLQLRPHAALSIVAISRPVEYVAGDPYSVQSSGRRLAIPLGATEVYLYLEGMAAALDLQDEASIARRRRRAPILLAEPGRHPGATTYREAPPSTRLSPPRQGSAGAVRPARSASGRRSVRRDAARLRG